MEFTFGGEHHKVVLGSGNNRGEERETDRRAAKRREGGCHLFYPDSRPLPPLLRLSGGLAALAGWRVRLGGSLNLGRAASRRCRRWSCCCRRRRCSRGRERHAFNLALEEGDQESRAVDRNKSVLELTSVIGTLAFEAH